MAVSLYSPNQQTRQQLEELDALLQRMLALPSGANEPNPGEVASLPANPELFAPSPPTLPLPARPQANGQPIVQAWRVQSPPAPEALVFPFSGQQPPLATPVDCSAEYASPQPRFFASPVVATTTPANPAPLPYAMIFGPQAATAALAMPPGAAALGTEIPVPQWEAAKSTAIAPPLPVSLWPILVLNKIFDLLTLPLGPLGSWLRRPGGRNVLGWLGILMILGAIGWGVADWYGLDWTR